MILSFLSERILLIKRLKKRLSESALAYRFAKGAFWSLAGAVISRGLMLVASIAVVRILGKVEFGELGIIQGTVGMFGTLAGLGLGLTATKYVAEFKHSDPAKTGRIISLSLMVSIIFGGIVSLILILFATWLSTHILSAPHLGAFLRTGAGLLFLSAINGTQMGALAGFESFKSISRINLLAGLLSFPLMAGGAYFAGLNGAVLGLILSMGLNCVMSHKSLGISAKEFGVHMAWADFSRERDILWQFSLPSFLSSTTVGSVNWACSALLVNQPGGYAEMGVLSAANQWRTAILFLPMILGQVLMPILSERIKMKDGKTAQTILIYSMMLNAIVLIPVTLLGCFWSHDIMAAYGKGFEGTWLTLIVVLMTACFLAIQTPVGQVIAAAGKMWMGFIMNLLWAIATIICTLLLIKKGALGVAAAQLFGYLIHGVWTLGYASRIIRSRYA